MLKPLHSERQFYLKSMLYIYINIYLLSSLLCSTSEEAISIGLLRKENQLYIKKPISPNLYFNIQVSANSTIITQQSRCAFWVGIGKQHSR